jgi:hypothetical protein
MWTAASPLPTRRSRIASLTRRRSLLSATNGSCPNSIRFHNEHDLEIRLVKIQAMLGLIKDRDAR